MVRHRRGLFRDAAVLERAVIPVARKLWLPNLVSIPAAAGAPAPQNRLVWKNCMSFVSNP
jgi:hypothetical protein